MMDVEHPRFIVLLRHPNGIWLPLVDEDDNPLGFESEDHARRVAETNSLADAYGALIIDTDDGAEV